MGSFPYINSGNGTLPCPLAVPEILSPRFRSQNFDRGANPCSLFPPPAALTGVARHQLEYFSIYTLSDAVISRQELFNCGRWEKKVAERKGFEPLALSSHWFSRPAP